MPNGDFHCVEHSGCIARIENLESTNKDQWTEIGKVNKKFDDKFDKIFMRLNIVLGSLALACILLVINIIIKALLVE